MTKQCQVGKAEGSRYGHFVKACLIGIYNERSSWFSARIDTGSDVTIVPATAFREITPDRFRIGMIDLVYADGKLRERRVRTFSCGVYIEGLGTLQSRCGIIPKNVEVGALGMDILKGCKFYMDGAKRGILSWR